MKVRVTIGKDGILRDRNGASYGRVTALTLELDAANGPGAMGQSVLLPQQPTSSGVDGGSSNAVVASAGNKSADQQPTIFDNEAGDRSPQGADANSELIPGDTGAKYDPVADVWDHYCTVMNPRHKGLDPQQRAAIRDALKVGTVSELKGAISGCGASPFHMGDNDRRKKYNSITQILKAKRGGRSVREQIDFFLDLGAKSGAQSQVPSESPARVSQEKRAVLDGMDFPHDAHVQDRAREAEGWLRQHGVQFDRESRTFLDSPEAVA